MAFSFGILGFSAISDPYIIQGTESDDTSTVGSYIGNTFSLTSMEQSVAQTADGDFPDDGGANLTADLTINGTTYSAGSEIEADWEFITYDPSSGYYFRITGLYVNNQPVGLAISRAWDASTGQYVSGDAGVYQAGTTLTHIDGDDLDGTPNSRDFLTDSNYSSYGSGRDNHHGRAADGMGNDATLTNSNGVIVCFTPGCLIRTIRGETPVEDLQIGDLVLTMDEGYQPITWLGRRKLNKTNFRDWPNLRPIRIAPGALGRGFPDRETLLSPQHRVLIASRIAERMFGQGEVLTAAKQLTGIPGIDVAEDVDEVEYIHFMFRRHQVVFANGAPMESLFTGPEALKAVGPEAAAEILTLMPELREPDLTPARLIARGTRARNMIRRHIANHLNLWGEPALTA